MGIVNSAEGTSTSVPPNTAAAILLQAVKPVTNAKEKMTGINIFFMMFRHPLVVK
jgi:hypothetical protein